ARANVEADNQRARGGGQVDVALSDAADARVDDADAHLGVLDLLDLADRGLDGALDVGLDDQAELLDLSFLHLFEQALERDAPRTGGELLTAEPLVAHLCQVSRLPLVL